MSERPEIGVAPPAGVPRLGHLSAMPIAQRPDVSVNTVKTHLEHIYRTSLVTGRREAVAAAEQMRLLSGTSA